MSRLRHKKGEEIGEAEGCGQGQGQGEFGEGCERAREF